MSTARGISAACLLLLASGCRIHSTPTEPVTPPPAESENHSVAEMNWNLQGRLYSDARIETDGQVGADFDVDVSPDGMQIVFASTRFTNTPKVFLKDTQGGGVMQKTSGKSRDIQPKFSPDGKKIAFASDRYGNFDILVVSAAHGGGLMQLTQSTADEVHPTWSPDAKRIAYSMREGNDWNIWIIELEGQRRTKLGPGLYPEWSPDGKYLAFQRPSGRGRGWHGVWVVNVEGGSPREVATSESWAAVQPSWAPNSRRLAFATARNSGLPGEPPRADDLWIVDLDEGYRYQLTQHPGEDYAPAWGLDGRIYFTSSRGGTPSLWSLEPVNPQELFDENPMAMPKAGL